MRTYFFTMALLCAGLTASAQYSYFNNLYEVDSVNNSLNYKIIRRPNFEYLNVGHMIEISNNIQFRGSLLRLIDGSGDVVNRINQTFSIWPTAAGFGNPNESVLELPNHEIMQFHAVSNGLGGTCPLLIKFQEDLDTSWTKILVEGSLPSTGVGWTDISGLGMTNLSDTTFMLLTYNRWGPMNTPDSLRIKYTTYNLEGEQLAQYTQPVPHFWMASGIRKLNENELILWGQNDLDGDWQNFVWKTDYNGNILDSIYFGNPDICQDGWGSIYIYNDKIYMPYSYCLQDGGFQNRLFEPRHLILNVADFSILSNEPFVLPYTDVLTSGISSVASKINFDDQIISLYSNDLSGIGGTKNFIVAFDNEGNFIWQQDYTSGYNYANEFLMDLEIAHDGGYICTGTTDVIYEDFSDMQKNWILKVDACGYEQPSGCAAVIGVNEKQNAADQIQLWPNPFYYVLKAVIPQNSTRVFITDMTGRTVFEERVYFPNQQFDLAMLNKGVYVFNVQLEDGIVVSKRTVKY